MKLFPKAKLQKRIQVFVDAAIAFTIVTQTLHETNKNQPHKKSSFNRKKRLISISKLYEITTHLLG